MFGIIGLGMAAYERRPTAALNRHLQDCAQLYLQLVKDEDADKTKRVADDTWDYLQLLGAWTKTFLADKKFSDELVQIVAYGRPFGFSFYGMVSSRDGGRYGRLGYPTLLFRDFSLPQPRNMEPHLTDSDLDDFRRIQERLISDETLLPFAVEVRRVSQG